MGRPSRLALCANRAQHKAMTQTMREFDDDWKTHAYEQDTFLQWAAERAYKMADAMLKVRES